LDQAFASDPTMSGINGVDMARCICSPGFDMNAISNMGRRLQSSPEPSPSPEPEPAAGSCVELSNVQRDLCDWTTVVRTGNDAAGMARCRAVCDASPSCFAIQWHLTENWCDTCTTTSNGITLDRWAMTSGDGQVQSKTCWNPNAIASNGLSAGGMGGGSTGGGSMGGGSSSSSGSIDPAALQALCSADCSGFVSSLSALVPSSQTGGVDSAATIQCMCDSPQAATMLANSNGNNVNVGQMLQMCAHSSCRTMLSAIPNSPSCATPSGAPAPPSYFEPSSDYSVTMSFVSTGAVEDYTPDVQDQMKVRIGSQLQVDSSTISLAITAASVNVQVEIQGASHAHADMLTQQMTNVSPSQMSSTFAGISVGGQPLSVAQVSQAPRVVDSSSSSSDDLPIGMIGGIAGGCFVPLLIFVLWACGAFGKKTRGQVGQSNTASAAAGVAMGTPVQQQPAPVAQQSVAVAVPMAVPGAVAGTMAAAAYGFCTSCGAPITQAAAKFCPSCGAPVKTDVSTV